MASYASLWQLFWVLSSFESANLHWSSPVCRAFWRWAALASRFIRAFRPLALLVGSAAGLYLALRWSYNKYNKYPYLSYKHAHSFFEGEAAMAAENARIEEEARELIKKRPYGPWLFR
jgi:hypothetical protein